MLPMNNDLLHTPDGMRDTYGQELARKQRVVDRIRDRVRLYGYEDIQTPSLEFYDVFSSEVGTTPVKELYKLLDNEGNLLVLRPDFTPAVARCAAKYFSDEKEPIRFTYAGSVFGNASSLQGKLCETTQMGAELINEPSVYADAEILEKAVRAEAQIYPPGRENAEPSAVTLEQVSADTFEGAADTDEAGAYAMKIMLYDREGNELLAADCGAAVPWTREYDLRNTEDGILQKLSSETGGRAVESPEALTDFPDTAARKRRDLTPWLMLLAGLVFLFDIAQRRLDLLKEKDKKKDAAGPAAPEAAPKREKKAKKPEPEQPQAAEVLWQSLQTKKRL